MKSQVFLNKVREFLPWSQTHTGEAPARILSVDAGPFEPQAFAVVDDAKQIDVSVCTSVSF